MLTIDQSNLATFRTVFLRYTAELSRYGIRTVKGLNFKKFGRMPTADYRYGTVRSPSCDVESRLRPAFRRRSANLSTH